MKTETLDSLLQEVINMPSVAGAYVWIPTAEEVAEYAADGIDAKPSIEVEVWRSERNPHDVVCQIESLGLERVGTGSGLNGPCYSFQLRAA